MASIVSAGTTSATALNMSADTSGVLQLASNNGTVAVTVDTSQNVGVGTTSPVYTLDVGGPLANIRVAPSTATNNALTRYVNTGGTGYVGLDSSAGGLTSAYALNLYHTGAYPIVFSTSNTERARIDSNGALLVGTTSQVLSEKVNFTNNDSNPVLVAVASGSTQNSGGVVSVRAARNTTSNTFYAYSYYNTGGAAFKFIVADSGNVTNTNNSYGAISDAKLKENIVDATPKLADLMQVKVRNYNFKSDPTHKQLGVVAQELEQVFPAMVEETSDRDAEGNHFGTTTKQVKYSVFVPMLIKSIQEQQALIIQLQADVAALKGAA